MEFIKSLLGMTTKKAIKVQDYKNPHNRFGIVASNLYELKKKACGRLKIDISAVTYVVLEEDGTEITDNDFFQTLPPHTAVLILVENQFWNGSMDYLKHFFLKLQECDERQQFMNDINTFLSSTDGNDLLVDVLSVLKEKGNENIAAERLEDDPAWFEQLQFSCKTKSEAMRRYSKQRVRGYYSKVKELETKMTSKANYQKLSKILEKFRNMLGSVDYYGVYFDRTSNNSEDCFCDSTGLFTCEGAHNETMCYNHHMINPYASKDTRVLFSTWNLDHQIEKSREVLPSLQNAIEKSTRNKQINIEYYFNLLFTRNNLKLVDVRCHRKTIHKGLTVDKRLIFL